MVLYQDIKKRAPMYVSIDSRLLGVAITIFVLIFTFKSSIFKTDSIMIFELVLSIPLLIGAMISNAKIIDQESFKQYYLFSRISNALGNAFIFNALGLIVVSYVSFFAGMTYFILLLFLLACMTIIDFNKRKIYNEVLMMIVILFGGVLAVLSLV